MSSEESPESTLEPVSRVVQTPTTKCQSGRKHQGKVPKRIHKAEREKMKREHLNDLFLSLANALEVSEETNGKASVLSEAIRFVKDMLAQIESLRSENAALSSESQYMTMEKEELQDETNSLESQIAELQNQVRERVGEAELDLNATPGGQFDGSTPHQVDDCFRFPALGPAIQQPQNVKPVYVIPLCSDPSVFQQPGNAETASSPLTTVSKPQARYPTPADTWTSQLLEKHPDLGGGDEHCGGRSC